MRYECKCNLCGVPVGVSVTLPDGQPPPARYLCDSCVNLPPLSPLNDPDVKAELKEYFTCTKQLRQFAGQTVPDGEWIKLEDADYKATMQHALIANAENQENLSVINLIGTSLLYTFFQLTMKYGIPWEQFRYDGSY